MNHAAINAATPATAVNLTTEPCYEFEIVAIWTLCVLSIAIAMWTLSQVWPVRLNL